ncbi:hypothetical protein GGS26DRAFT_501108 [Hypomontagnella submonticulosa]|nr:hypothetical protein GGS26DRAFT_501108 [Hypomontagnella submonticulosa]
MTRVFQLGLAIEAVLNIAGAVPFVLHPEWCLSFAVAPDPKTGISSVPPSSAVLWQTYGALVLALTVPLIQCIPDFKAATEKRRIIFQTLLAGEVFLEALLLSHISQPDKSGFTWNALVLSAIFLLPALSWHAFALYIKPSLLQNASSLSSRSSKKTR